MCIQKDRLTTLIICQFESDQDFLLLTALCWFKSLDEVVEVVLWGFLFLASPKVWDGGSSLSLVSGALLALPALGKVLASLLAH